MENFKNLLFRNKNRCYICLEEEDDYEEYICTTCNSKLEENYIKSNLELKYIDELYFTLFYNRYMRGKIIEFKFQDKNYLYKPFANYLYKSYRENKISNIDYIVYIPSHRSKEIKRGFNQSALLAKSLSNHTGIEVLDILHKERRTKDQSSLSKGDRKENLVAAFSMENEEIIRDKDLLLVDDIFTTGATIEEVAKLLKEKGARRVVGLCLCSNTND